MLELFRVEAEQQMAMLTSGLLELERGPAAPAALGNAHASRPLLQGGGADCESSERSACCPCHGRLFCLGPTGTSWHCASRKLICSFAALICWRRSPRHTEASIARWDADHAEELRQFLDALASLTSAREPPVPADGARLLRVAESPSPSRTAQEGSSRDSSLQTEMVPATPEAYSQQVVARRHEDPDRVVRITAQSLNRLLGLAGESLVESRWLRPFADSLQRLKRHQTELSEKLDDLAQPAERRAHCPSARNISLASWAVKRLNASSF